ncbi:MAG: putative glutamine amidotransferase [Planctomycetes bacterium]|nr:putative glutamine amidotransferase [Planctomycetota bacterium]
MRRIRVGIADQGKEEKLRLYAERVTSAGGSYEVLPWTGDAQKDAARFDALVLCGGDDVDARHWGEENHPTVELVPAIRDAYEIALVRAAAERRVPMLGVCRGGQVMNVAMGGTLVQHVPDLPGAGMHAKGHVHEVALAPGTHVRRLRGAERARVNSWHHQAVGRLGRGLVASARCGDGVVEGVEAGDGFFVGVQWHPEREGNDEELASGLFRALVEAAGRRANPGN